MAGRSGIEYHYRFWTHETPHDNCTLFAGTKNLLFEIRTDFVLKSTEGGGGGEEFLDSETLNWCSTAEDGDRGFDLYLSIRYRLLEYWMTETEATELIRRTIDFARQTAAAHPQPNSSSTTVVPIAVGLKVCTVQQDGETISAARERAIRAEHLVPLYLWPFTPESWRIPPDLRYFFMKRRIRVEKIDEGLGLMKMCAICSRGPWIGAVITRLLCGHAFHSHCVVRWLEHDNRCPCCYQQAHPLLSSAQTRDRCFSLMERLHIS